MTSGGGELQVALCNVEASLKLHRGPALQAANVADGEATTPTLLAFLNRLAPRSDPEPPDKKMVEACKDVRRAQRLVKLENDCATCRCVVPR